MVRRSRSANFVASFSVGSTVSSSGILEFLAIHCKTISQPSAIKWLIYPFVLFTTDQSLVLGAHITHTACLESTKKMARVLFRSGEDGCIPVSYVALISAVPFPKAPLRSKESGQRKPARACEGQLIRLCRRVPTVQLLST